MLLLLQLRKKQHTLRRNFCKRLCFSWCARKVATLCHYYYFHRAAICAKLFRMGNLLTHTIVVSLVSETPTTITFLFCIRACLQGESAKTVQFCRNWICREWRWTRRCTLPNSIQMHRDFFFLFPPAYREKRKKRSAGAAARTTGADSPLLFCWGYCGGLRVGIGGVMSGLRPPDGGAFAVQRPLDSGWMNGGLDVIVMHRDNSPFIQA